MWVVSESRQGAGARGVSDEQREAVGDGGGTAEAPGVQGLRTREPTPSKGPRRKPGGELERAPRG